MIETVAALETVACNLCGADDSVPVVRGEDYELRTPGAFTLVCCRQCGLKYINPRPPLSEMSRHYPENYQVYSTEKPQPLRFGKGWRAQLAKATERAYLRRYRGYPLQPPTPKALDWLLAQPRRADFLRVNWVENGKLLEVGCGTGRYLGHMRELNWQTYGVEINPAVAEFARQQSGVEVFTGTLIEARYPDHFFDVVVYQGVLEHLHDPMADLREVRRILKPGGQLVIWMQNWRSLGRVLFGRYWRGLEIPRHLYHAELPVLKKMLFKAGFSRVIREDYNFLAGIWLESLLFVFGKNRADLRGTRGEKMYGFIVRNFDRLTIPEFIFNFFKLSDIIEVSATYQE